MREPRLDGHSFAAPRGLGRRLLGLATAGIGALLLLSPVAIRAQPALETFDSDLGAWDFTFGTQNDGFDIGWSDSEFAGGVPGEVGGLFVRLNQPTGDLSMPRILDEFGTSVDLNQPFHASGSMFLDDDSNDAGLDVHVGFFNHNDPTSQRLILRILPNGNDEWRFRVSVNTSSGARIDAPVGFDSVPLAWSFDWTPSGQENGTGTLVGSVSDGQTTLDLPAPVASTNTAMVDSFGVWANSASSTDPARTQRMFFDDVEYTVPEPERALAGAAAVLALSLRIARSRRG